MYTPNDPPKLKNNNGHTGQTMDIMTNAVAAGKVSENKANEMLDIASPAKPVSDTIKSIIRATPIDPDNLDGQYHPTIIKQATKSWDDIQSKEPGGLNTLKKNAPEIYKAKFLEKHGRMPSA